MTIRRKMLGAQEAHARAIIIIRCITHMSNLHNSDLPWSENSIVFITFLAAMRNAHAPLY